MKKKTNLIILLPGLGVGGAEQFLTSLANSLQDDFDICFYLFSNNKKLEYKLDKAEVVSSKSTLLAILKLPFFLASRSPQTVLSSIIDINLITIVAAKLFCRKTNIVIREAQDPSSALRLFRFPKIVSILYKKLYPLADSVVSLSPSMKKDLLSFAPKLADLKVHIIGNAVDESRFLPLPIHPSSNNKILAIGRLEYQKGYDVLLKAFALLEQNYRLTIIGTGNQYRSLIADIEKLGIGSRVDIIEYVKNPKEYIASSSFLVLSSRHEGVSNVMLEALVNGLPVVACKEKTSAEFYINESNGVLVDQCSVEALFTGIKEIEQRLSVYDRSGIAKNSRAELSMFNAITKYALVMEANQK